MSWISDIGMVVFYVWTAACLCIVILFLAKVGMSLDEVLLGALLFFIIYFFPLWYPVIKIKEYFECRKIKKWRDEVKRKYEEIKERKDNEKKEG